MSIESKQDWDGLRQVGRIVSLILRDLQSHARPGITTAELDALGAMRLESYGARSAPMVLYGFPGALCISLNDEVVHGIPSDRCIHPGDLVTLDLTAEYGGYIADAAITVGVPPVSDEQRRLMACAEGAFYAALRVAQAGHRVRDIGRAVEQVVRRSGFAVIRELAGHGVGRAIHEEPSVPNYWDVRARQRLTRGLVLTVEPMIAAGSGRVYEASDGWTVKTADGSRAAHYEQTVVVTKHYPVLLTAV